MTRFLTLTTALLGLGLLLAPLAEAGGGGKREGSRGSSPRAPSVRSAPARVATPPSTPSRSFARQAPTPTFRTRSQPTFQQPFTSSSSNRRGGSSLPWSSRGPSAGGASGGIRTPPSTVGTWNRSSPTWTRSAPSGEVLRDRAAAARGDAALGRLRTRAPTTTPFRTAPSVVSPGGRSASPGVDTGRTSLGSRTLGSRTFGTRSVGSQGAAVSGGLRAGNPIVTAPGAATRDLGRVRTGTSTAFATRFGSRRQAAGFSTSPRIGTTRTSTAFRSGGIGTRSATGGSVSTRIGTRSSRIGRSYRISGPIGHHHRHHHGPLFGFYYSWYPWRVPYYDIYPSYGLYFGYGLSYYGPAYETVFVDATDYAYPTEVIVEEEIIEQVPAAPAPVPAPAPPADGGFPAPAPQAGPAAPEGAEAQPERKPHPDFEPAVQDFLAGRYQQSLERLDRVVQAEPDNGEAWLAAMHANFALGRYGRAAAALAEAAALDAFPRGYRFDPRPLYAKTGNFDRALQALDSHIAANPKDVDAVLLRAYLHVSLGERNQAQDLIQRALEIRPADETAPALALALLPPPPPPQPEKAGK